MAARNNPPSAVEIVLKLLGAIVGAILLGYLLWRLRSLILPVTVGALLAYICSPLVVGLERYRVTRGLAIGLLLLAFVSAALLIASLVRAGIPTEIRALDFKTRALHKVNERYRSLMGLDASPRGNRLYGLVHDDVEPAMDRVNRLLAMTSDERARFLEAHAPRPNRPEDSAALLDFDRDNLEALARRGLAPADDGVPEGEARPDAFTPRPRPAKTPLAALAAILSTWIIAPTVFLFLLRDTGEIKRAFSRSSPTGSSSRRWRSWRTSTAPSAATCAASSSSARCWASRWRSCSRSSASRRVGRRARIPGGRHQRDSLRRLRGRPAGRALVHAPGGPSTRSFR